MSNQYPPGGNVYDPPPSYADSQYDPNAPAFYPHGFDPQTQQQMQQQQQQSQSQQQQGSYQQETNAMLDRVLHNLGTENNTTANPHVHSKHACAYCGISHIDSVGQCQQCNKWFCNEVGETTTSHLLTHFITSHHRSFKHHQNSSNNDVDLECYFCNTRNVFLLGTINTKEDNIVAIVCRSPCLLSPKLKQHNFDISSWTSIIDKKQFLQWLFPPPPPEYLSEQPPPVPITSGVISKLEELWRTEPNASLQELYLRTQAFSNIQQTPDSFNNSLEYAKIFHDLVNIEAETDCLMKSHQSQEGLSLRWATSTTNEVGEDEIISLDTYGYDNNNNSNNNRNDQHNNNALPNNKRLFAIFTIFQEEETSLKIVLGDELILTFGNENDVGRGHWVGTGYAVKVALNGQIVMAIDAPCIANAPTNEEHGYKVQCAWKAVTYDRMHLALQKFADMTYILNPALYDQHMLELERYEAFIMEYNFNNPDNSILLNGGKKKGKKNNKKNKKGNDNNNQDGEGNKIPPGAPPLSFGLNPDHFPRHFNKIKPCMSRNLYEQLLGLTFEDEGINLVNIPTLQDLNNNKNNTNQDDMSSSSYTSPTLNNLMALAQQQQQQQGANDLDLALQQQQAQQNKNQVIIQKLPNLPPLNSFQQDAILTSLRSTCTLLQGPPGAGKSMTSAYLVHTLHQSLLKDAEEHFLLTKQKKKINPILVCAPSNIAVDHLAEKLHLAGLKVVRVASRSRQALQSTVDFLSLHVLVGQLAQRSKKGRFYDLHQLVTNNPLSLTLQQRNEYRTLVQSVSNAILNNADVICTTCISTGDSRLFQDFTFEHVLIDEATQCPEPEILLPMTYGCKQVILIGDHCQLGPVVLSKYAARAGYNRSLFERLLLRGHVPKMLQIQYRMHPELAKFPADTFYDGNLANGLKVKDRQFAHHVFPWPNVSVPMCFIASTGSLEEYSASGTSYLNRLEVNIIEKCIIYLVQHGIQLGQIGVITPYEGQRLHLMSALSRDSSPLIKILNGLQQQENKDGKKSSAPTAEESVLEGLTTLNNLEIASVDSFQGREKDIILFTCVRSNDHNDLGFLCDPRRLNVALTRAKYGMIMTGNPKVLLKHPLWHALLCHFKLQKCFVEGGLDGVENLKPCTIALPPSKTFLNARNIRIPLGFDPKSSFGMKNIMDYNKQHRKIFTEKSGNNTRRDGNNNNWQQSQQQNQHQQQNGLYYNTDSTQHYQQTLQEEQQQYNNMIIDIFGGTNDMTNDDDYAYAGYSGFDDDEDQNNNSIPTTSTNYQDPFP